MSNTSRQSAESTARSGAEGTNQPPSANLKPVQVKLVLLGEFFFTIVRLLLKVYLTKLSL